MMADFWRCCTDTCVTGFISDYFAVKFPLYFFCFLFLLVIIALFFSAGSNDALPPGLPANVLGIQDDKPPDTTAIKHKEGVCSERAKPKLAWAEEQMIAQEGAPGSFSNIHAK